MTITDILISGAEKLEGMSTLPFLDAEVLLAFVLEKNRAYVIAHSSDTVSIVQERQYHNLIGRRAAGEPIAYITGHKEFFGHTFTVDERVLVPRPESEKIVELVIDAVKERYGTAEHARILDIGTGSGCLAISINKALGDQAHIIATDISAESLELAYENAEALGANVQFLHGDVYTPLPDGIAPFDIIVSNPPYLDVLTTQTNTPETAALSHEPPHSLFAEDAGFAVIERILHGATKWLLPYGVLILEIGDNQAGRTEALAKETLPTHRFELIPEWSGRGRIVVLWPTTK